MLNPYFVELKVTVVVMAGPAGGILYGRIFDQTGSYDLAFMIASGCFLVAAAAFSALSLVSDRPGQAQV